MNQSRSTGRRPSRSLGGEGREPGWVLAVSLAGAVVVSGCGGRTASWSGQGRASEAPGPSWSADTASAEQAGTPAAEETEASGLSEPKALASDAPAGALPDAGTACVRRVMLVTVDGLGSVYLERALAEGRVPALAALGTTGVLTYNARADYTHTFTLPGHVTILTGRPVMQVEGWPETVHHGYVKNFDPAPGETLHNAGNPALDYVASVFDVAHDHGFRTCLYATKTKFSIFAQSYDAEHGAPDRIGEDQGRNKIDRFVVIDHDSPALVRKVSEDFAVEPCDLSLVHLTELDSDGHVLEWGSPEWMARLEQADGWVGRLWDALARAGGGADRWALVVTADHGGIGYDHFDPAALENYRIPFYLLTAGLPSGADLYALVGTARSDPGPDRPSYSDPVQPIRNGDAANLALGLMCLPEVPGSMLRGLTSALGLGQ